MNTIPETSYPLQWPLGKPRTPAHKRQFARFDTTEAAARDGVIKELQRLGAQRVVITTNVSTYMRGGREVPYANQQAAKEDPGVAVYYVWQGDTYALACDRWKRMADNYQAIRKTIEAIRGLDGWGTGDMLKAAFAGFKALPPANTTRETPWWEILGVSRSATRSEVDEAYGKKKRVTHPDAGGSHEAFIAVQQAYEQSKESI